MQDKQKETNFDVRIVERNVAAGRLERADVVAYLENIEDCSDEADWTTTGMAIPQVAEAAETED